MQDNFSKTVIITIFLLLAFSVLPRFFSQIHAVKEIDLDMGDAAATNFAGDGANSENLQEPEAIAILRQNAADPQALFHLLAASEEPHMQPSIPASFNMILRSGITAPPPGIDPRVPAQLKDQESAHFFIQFYRLPSAGEKDAIPAALLDYIPVNTYVAAIARDQLAQLEQNENVRSVIPILPGNKYSQSLLKEDLIKEDGKSVIYAYVYPDVELDQAKASVEATGSSVISEISTLNVLIVKSEKDKISDIAKRPEVLFIDHAYPQLDVTNDGSRAAANVNQVQASPFNLDGSGIKALIYDVGLIDPTHNDLLRRVIWRESSSNPIVHATHVAGTFGGTGANSNGLYRGMALVAQMFSYVYENCTPRCIYNNPGDMQANFNAGINQDGVHLIMASIGANIVQNGYPCSWLGDYELTDILLDGIISQGLPAGINKGTPIIWSAGNERGPMVCGTNYNTMGVPGTAKNTIVVGAVNADTRSMTLFSSWGPTDDGRVKPDVVAAGCSTAYTNVNSTFPGNQYRVFCGTSMAAPAAAGVVALLLQQHRNSDWQTQLPFTVRNKAVQASRMKALLIHTATDLGNPGPDYQNGYGLVNALAGATQLKSYQSCIIEKKLDATNAPDEFVINTLNASQSALEATLVWDDPPASPLAQVTLVNNLDLQVTSPTGSIALPLILDPANPANNAVPGVNNRDNIEQVTVAAQGTGAWNVKVLPSSIPQGPQGYSLIVTPPQGTPIVSLVGGAPLIGNQDFKIQVDAPYPNHEALLALHLSNTPGISIGDGRIIPVNINQPYVVVQTMLDANGRAIIPASIPNNPTFAGVTAYATAIVLDPAAAGTPAYINGISCSVPMLFFAA